MSDAHDDGPAIDPNDVPVPGLCRLCTRYLDPEAPLDSGASGGGDQKATIAQSMQRVHCTLLRMDHALDDNNDPRTDDAPFTCSCFRSRFGTGAIWH